MKFKLISTLLVVAFVSIAPSMVMAEGGAPDTLILLTNRPEAGLNDSLFIVELWIWNDVDAVSPQFGFEWTSDLLTLDSAKGSAAAVATWNFLVFFDGGNIAQSNANNRAQFAGISFIGNNMNPSMNRQLIATYYFTLSSWTASDMITVDSLEWDAGSEMLFNSSTETYTPVYWWGDRPIQVRDPSDVAGQNGLPAEYSLSQNYPNPFNPETTIEFSLEKAGDYTFTVYNVIGQVVYEVNGIGDIGANQIIWNANNQASGVYFYKLAADGFTETKKMMLLK